MRQEQLAINSISTRHSDLEEALEAYSAAGFRQVEFHLPLIRQWLVDGRTLADVAALLKSRELKSIGGFEVALFGFAPESERSENHRVQRENAEMIHALGGGTLVVGTDGPPIPSVEALPVLADAVRLFANSIDNLDVTVALEFNWGPLVKSLASAVEVCERVGCPNVGILFDPAHYHCTVTKFEDLDQRSIPWIKHVHLDDMQDKPGELSNCNSDRVLPGEGILDLAALITRIESGGYTGAFSIEMFNDKLWELPSAEAARRCYESLVPLCTS